MANGTARNGDKISVSSRHLEKDNANLANSGHNAQGTLAYNLGYGEYLDTDAIGQARQAALQQGPVNQKLKIAKLGLTGFVVDMLPFNRWFDRKRLREIHFLHDCVDAGFNLSTWEEDVIVTYGYQFSPRVVHFTPYSPPRIKEVVVGRKRTKSKRRTKGLTI